MQHIFNIKRLSLLLKMELANSRKGILMTLTITFGFLFIMGMILAPVFEPDLTEIEYHTGYVFTLLLCGFILTSMAFRENSNTLRRYRYLTLPVSAFERFLSMWLLTTFGWIVFYTLTYWLYTLFANSVGQLLYPNIRFEAFNPFDQRPLFGMRLYFVLQSIFLVGAVHFRKYPFPKTLLTIILFAAVCGFIVYLILKNHFNIQCEPTMPQFEQMAVYPIWLTLQGIFWWLLAPICWVISYLGLKEQEV